MPSGLRSQVWQIVIWGCEGRREQRECERAKGHERGYQAEQARTESRLLKWKTGTLRIKESICLHMSPRGLMNMDYKYLSCHTPSPRKNSPVDSTGLWRKSQPPGYKGHVYDSGHNLLGGKDGNLQRLFVTSIMPHMEMFHKYLLKQWAHKLQFHHALQKLQWKHFIGVGKWTWPGQK